MVSYQFGAIVTAAGGPWASKPRPVVVFQQPTAKTGGSIVILPLTSQENPEIPFRVSVAPTSANGLDRDCFIEVDKISAITSDAIGKQIGQLDTAQLNAAVSLLHQLIELPG
jgi:mRNA interferase MazF